MVACGVLLVGTLFLAYTNGANDNFKGVATLVGSRTTGYRQALIWGTVATFAGSVLAVLLSGGLVAAFSGKGLVSDALTNDPTFLAAVGLGAAATVLVATLIGAPISTTHALTGALVGSGFVASGGIAWSRLGDRFLVPLAVSPLLSLVLTAAVYRVLRAARRGLGVTSVVEPPVDVAAGPGGASAQDAVGVERYVGRVLGADSQTVVERLHYASAGLTSLARGLNDTPKIAALLIAAGGLGLPKLWGLVLVGIAMAAGGLLSARRVATTMSERITTMNQGQGFSANLVTSLLVAFASRWGLPVSTTHVSCGSLFGVGAATGRAKWSAIRAIVLAWIVTLPMGAACAGVLYLVLA